MTPSIFLQNRGFFNPESRERGLPDDLTPQPVFTPVEQKLIRLGLDPAGHQGEIDVCASKLFGSLRRRGVNAERIIAAHAQALWAARELSAARGRVMTFGKYRGKTVGELPLDYIRWALRKCDNLPYNVRRAMRIVLNEGVK